MYQDIEGFMQGNGYEGVLSMKKDQYMGNAIFW